MNWTPFLVGSALSSATVMVDYRIAMQFRALGIFAFDALRTKAQYYIKIIITHDNTHKRHEALQLLRKMTVIPFGISASLFVMLLCSQFLKESDLAKINEFIGFERYEHLINVFHFSAFFAIIAMADIFFGYSGTLLNMRADNKDYYIMVTVMNVVTSIILGVITYHSHSLIMVALTFAMLRLALNYTLWLISVRKFKLNVCPFINQ
jgi:hypothetical protein